MRKEYFKIIPIILACSLLALLFAGCGKTKDVANLKEPNEFTIVTSFYPMYIATINVAKDIPNVKVINMTKPQSGCLHDYQLSPADLKTLEKADTFIINGAGMEAFMDKVIKQIPSLKVIEASKGIELIKNKTDGEENPHVWVSITNAITQTKNIAEELSSADTKNADKYKKNADEYIAKLEAQRTKMHESLDSIKNKDIITFHEAFPYFAEEFNLNVVAIIEREPGAAPSAGELADTIKTIKDSGIKALFAEPQYSPKAADSIASQTSAKVYFLDPIVTGTENPQMDDYLTIMDENLRQLIEAFKNE